MSEPSMNGSDTYNRLALRIIRGEAKPVERAFLKEEFIGPNQLIDRVDPQYQEELRQVLISS